MKDKWAALDELNKKLGYVGTDEGFTVQEYADRYKLSESTATHRLQRLSKNGHLKTGWRYVIDTSGKKRKIRVYTI